MRANSGHLVRTVESDVPNLADAVALVDIRGQYVGGLKRAAGSAERLTAAKIRLRMEGSCRNKQSASLLKPEQRTPRRHVARDFLHGVTQLPQQPNPPPPDVISPPTPVEDPAPNAPIGLPEPPPDIIDPPGPSEEPEPPPTELPPDGPAPEIGR